MRQKRTLEVVQSHLESHKINPRRRTTKKRNLGLATPAIQSSPFSIGLTWFLVVWLCLLGAVVAWAWIMPVDYFQNKLWENAGTDPYRQFEAVGKAEAACWLVRIAGPLFLIVLATVLCYVDSATRFLHQLSVDILQTTAGPSPTRIFRPRLVANLLRLALLGWFFAAGIQWIGSVDRRLTDWPYYRFRSGAQVLPNISEANRDVIRYLRKFTPPQSRILVVSDQKLFFLSYYLLPRKLFHKIHPASEFVIPLANQERQLAAYHYEDLDSAWIEQGQFDFILEYFEHPAAFTKDQVAKDPQWIQFVREAHRDPAYLPPFYVRLKSQSERQTP